MQNLIVIASNNPVKIQAVLNGFERMFPGQNFTTATALAPSGVSDQPSTSNETLQGAYNRAYGARQIKPEGDFWVGIEGGTQDEACGMAAFAWVVILSREKAGRSRTGTFFLPPRVAELVRQGVELGHADDIVFGRLNSKQDNGAVGILTGDVIDRTGLYEHAVILALVPFKKPELFPGEVEVSENDCSPGNEAGFKP